MDAYCEVLVVILEISRQQKAANKVGKKETHVIDSLFLVQIMKMLIKLFMITIPDVYKRDMIL